VTATDSTGYELPTWAPLPARPDPALDELARRTATELRVHRALVVLVSKSGQVYPGAFGLPEPWESRRSMPLSHSMSLGVANDGRPMVVRDTREVPGLRDRFAVRDMAVVGFAAMPLADGDGRPVGVLSVGDDRPRDWTDEELATLRRLAGEASALVRVRVLELAEREARGEAERAHAAARRAVDAASAALTAAEAEADRARLVVRLSQELLPAQTLPDVLRAVDRCARSPLGAAVALLGLADTGRPDVRVWSVAPGAGPAADPVAVLPVSGAHPLTVAVAEHRLVLVPTRTELPGPVRLPGATADTSLTVPLALGQHAGTGGLLLGWDHRRDVDPWLSAVVGDLGRHVGHALDRVLLREARLALASAGTP
jgi:GAF domain-containing protein